MFVSKKSTNNAVQCPYCYVTRYDWWPEQWEQSRFMLSQHLLASFWNKHQNCKRLRHPKGSKLMLIILVSWLGYILSDYPVTHTLLSLNDRLSNKSISCILSHENLIGWNTNHMKMTTPKITIHWIMLCSSLEKISTTYSKSFQIDSG